MNSFAQLFLVLNAVALFALPRHWALLPILMGACYMTPAQSLDIGPFHFTVLRILLLLGFVRALIRGERLAGGLKQLDWILLFWGLWLLCSSAFHKPFGEALVFRLGAAYNALGIYFLIRIFCQNASDLTQAVRITAILLVPVAVEMLNEKLSGRNAFAWFGGVPEMVQIRDGKLRAQGPFGHPILAGTVGAICVPLMVGIWRQHRLSAMIGLGAALMMVMTSKSSGPLMSLAIGIFALSLWRWRHLTRQMCITAVIAYLFLEAVMSDPAYFVLARIDLTGSSTGWHRAEIIRQSIHHFSEWWFAGTDYTRHYMPTGVSASPDHTDFTNHYLFYGVIWGGLPLMSLFVFALWVAFRYVGHSLRLQRDAPFAEQFLTWCLGATLFTHAATCLSVAYFDQSWLFLYLNLAVIGSLYATALATARKDRHAAELAERPHDDLDEGLRQMASPPFL